MELIEKVRSKIVKASVYSKSKSNNHGEVFTPFSLIAEMVKEIPLSTLTDPSKTYFDPCAGKGNFPITLVGTLIKTLAKAIPDEEERLRHIIEKQIYMAEFQRESCEFIAEAFTFSKGFKVNLYYGDTLKMPKDFFDLPWEERQIKYPDNCITQSDIKLEPTKLMTFPTATNLNIVNPNLTPDEFKRGRDLMALFS